MKKTSENNLSHISAFIKYKRKQAQLTQEELAQKAGVGLRFIRDLEQGKETLRLDKINQVLALFGAEMRAERDTVDPYIIFMNYYNVGVIVTLKDRKKLYGIIIDEITDGENKIIGWKFVPNNNAIEYHKKEDKSLETEIMHKDINAIEYQHK
jgi:y4mF family transcriptional regulator